MKKLLFYSTLIASTFSLFACTSKIAPTRSSESTTLNHKMPTAQEMEAAFKKMSTTTSEHAVLTQLEGTWKASASFTLSPEAKPEVSKAYAKNTRIFGGRFLREEYRGTFMGKPFQGLGYLGYDTVAGQFDSVWFDSMGTAMMKSTGQYDATTKKLTFSGKASCGMTSELVDTKAVYTFVDAKNVTFEMYTPGLDGNLFKSLEITYKKVK